MSLERGESRGWGLAAIYESMGEALEAAWLYLQRNPGAETRLVETEEGPGFEIRQSEDE